MKRGGEFALMTKRILCAGPDGEFAAGPFGNGRARFKWRMLDVGNIISLAKSLFGGGEFFGVRIFGNLSVFFEVIVKLFAGRMRSGFPFRSLGNGRERLLGLQGCGRGNADKLFLA